MDKFILIRMKIYHLYRRQHLNLTTQEAWNFFSSPYNLNDITPEFFHVTITSKVPEKIYAGLRSRLKSSFEASNLRHCPYMDTSRFASKNHLWFLGTTAHVYPTC